MVVSVWLKYYNPSAFNLFVFSSRAALIFLSVSPDGSVLSSIRIRLRIPSSSRDSPQPDEHLVAGSPNTSMNLSSTASLSGWSPPHRILLLLIGPIVHCQYSRLSSVLIV